jgi:hypothetical protein
MRRLSWALIAVAFTCVPAAAQQPADVCAMFGAAEIAAVIGSGISPGRQMVPGTCVWSGAGVSLTIARMDAGDAAAAAGLVAAVKARAQKGDVVSDERTLGAHAVSTVAANHRGVSVVASQGTMSWNLSVDSGDRAIEITTMLPKLRTLLKKAMAVPAR